MSNAAAAFEALRSANVTAEVEDYYHFMGWDDAPSIVITFGDYTPEIDRALVEVCASLGLDIVEWETGCLFARPRCECGAEH